jgi:hypothetical protein
MTVNSFTTPKWDVALEALARDESKKLSRPLQVEDFLRLAREHAIRFDDIMVTMFELVLNDEWTYLDGDQKPTAITRNEVNNLYVNGRLNDKDVREYDGYWSPNA